MDDFDALSWTADQRRGTCAIAPHPDLKARWDKELADAAKRKRPDGSAVLGLAREPRRLGFNDGVIIPPEAFPAGTPAAVIRSAAADRAPLRGTVRVAVVLVDFSDKQMAANQAHFQDLFFSTGVLPHGSVREYYTEVTNGLITLDGVVVGPYRMPQTLAWYANNGSGIGKNGTAFRSPQMALDAATASTAAVNFAPYDNDGNGYVDAFIVVHAGPGAEVTGSLGDIWSHKSTLATAFNTDGTKIYGYLTIPEDAKIGVSAHELGHLLFGFPDLYDTDYSSEGIGNWCLMSGGSWNGGGDIPSHPSAWCKANQGWAAVTNVAANGPITVQAVETSHSLFRLWKNGAAGSEYFLLENRQKIGSDQALPGDGLLLWHIDETQPGNTDETHYKVGLLQADGNRDLELNHNRGDAGDPFPGSAGKTSATSATSPNTKSYAGADTCVSIKSIPVSSAAMTVDVTVTCKSTLKDGKEHIKDLKDLQKDHKEFAKDVRPDKHILKDVHPDKNFLKDAIKDGKEFAKEFKEGGFEGWPPDRWKRGGGGWRQGGGGGFAAAAGPSLEDRLAALEEVVFGASMDAGTGTDQSAEIFIDASLRPDLMGAGGGQQQSAALEQRMAGGDAEAKREFDTQPGMM